MNREEESLKEIKGFISKEIKIVKELISIHRSSDQTGQEEKSMVESQVKALNGLLRKTIDEISGILDDMSIIQLLPISKTEFQKAPEKKELQVPYSQKIIETAKPETPKKTGPKHKVVNTEFTDLERKTIKRLKSKKKIFVEEKEKKPSKYTGFANKLFENFSQSLSKQKIFISLKGDLIKANMNFVVTSYISIMLLTTLMSAFVGIFIFLFFLFFNIGVQFPIVTSITESLASRFIKVFWIIFAIPLGTFFVMYVYPSIERSYIQNKINQELPFATIHMSAISESMVEPSKIFSIIISTEEYPFLQKELRKIINEINVYGYDLVTALRNVAFNNPSSKLSELLNGLATTITSGGALTDFFDKRSQSLLFEYRIEREKYTKTAETFMDIYISLVIAAPMILMLLLIMMQISGLGISLSASMITLIMVLGVAMINIIFLTFLQLKQPPA